jgi:4-carboxymuconolactone decarboxylase
MAEEAVDEDLLRLAMGDRKAQERFERMLGSPLAAPFLGVVRDTNAQVWRTPALPTKTHCLVNLAILAALGKNDEVKIRVRGLLLGGVSAEEIAAVFLHIAAYCGFPQGSEVNKILVDTVDEIPTQV